MIELSPSTEVEQVGQSGQKQHNEGNVSNVKTVLNLIMSVIGIGVLALPKGILKGGWAVSIMMFILTCSLSHVAVVLLYRCLYFVDPKKPLLSYQAIGEAAFGHTGKIVVAVVSYFNLFTVCACMLILLGDCLEAFWPHSSSLMRVSVGSLVALVLSWLPSLKEVAVISIVGVAAVLVTCVAVVSYCASHVGQADESESVPVVTSPWPVEALAVGISFANFMNSYTVTPVVPSIVASMRNPDKFPLLSMLAFALVSLVFATIGFSGYLAYGAEIGRHSHVGVAINMTQQQPDNKDSVSGKILNLSVQIGILLVCLSHFVSLFNPVAVSTEQLYQKLTGKTTGEPMAMGTRILLRSLVVAACYGVAAGVNNFTSLVNLLGATFVMLLQLIFPFSFHHALAMKHAPTKALPKYITSLVVSLGFAGMVLGTYASIRDLKK